MQQSNKIRIRPGDQKNDYFSYNGKQKDDGGLLKANDRPKLEIKGKDKQGKSKGWVQDSIKKEEEGRLFWSRGYDEW